MTTGMGGSSSLVGRELGSYQVVRELGEGGMGVVFEAEHKLLGRKVAIKTIRPDALSDHSFSQRFMLEARAISALDHPGIVRLYDFAIESGMPYIVMEHVKGKTLQEVIEGGRKLPPSTAVELLRPVAEALDHAHENGVVHRDVKPGNLLLAYDGRTLIMDFGLAHLSGFTMQTDPESVLGTPDYIAPEQVVGEKVDGRADIYSLAAVVFETVTGRPPFGGGSWIDVASRRLIEDAPHAHEVSPDVPHEFSKSLARALHRNPDRRPATAVEFFNLLAEAVERAVVGADALAVAEPSSGWRRLWPFGAAMAAAAVVSAGVITALGLAPGDLHAVDVAMHALDAFLGR